MRALRREIGEALKTYRLPGDNQAAKGVTIYTQHVPKAHLSDPVGQYHPLVVISCNAIEDDLEGTIAEIGITVGVHGESVIERDGRATEPWIDLLNLMGDIRLRLLSRRLVENRYQLILPLLTETSEVQPAPYYYGGLTARYVIRQVADERSITR